MGILKKEFDAVQQHVPTSGPDGPYGPVICVPCGHLTENQFFKVINENIHTGDATATQHHTSCTANNHIIRVYQGV